MTRLTISTHDASILHILAQLHLVTPSKQNQITKKLHKKLVNDFLKKIKTKVVKNIAKIIIGRKVRTATKQEIDIAKQLRIIAGKMHKKWEKANRV